ncbi:MAG: hypothetical protein C4330_06440 [Chitinophagaceae bacterium]
MHKYSPEDLLRYLYKETDMDMTAAIEEELKKDWALREKLAVMKTSMERLNNLTESPRTQVILNILKYAAATDTIAAQ